MLLISPDQVVTTVSMQWLAQQSSAGARQDGAPGEHTTQRIGYDATFFKT